MLYTLASDTVQSLEVTELSIRTTRVVARVRGLDQATRTTLVVARVRGLGRATRTTLVVARVRGLGCCSLSRPIV